MARSKYELTHWVKSILTHYLMEIFVDQMIIKRDSFTLHIKTSNWDSYLTSTDFSLTLVTEIGGMG